MVSRSCQNNPNKFCYICGTYMFHGDQVKISTTIKERYAKYFLMSLGDQDKSFAPHFICKLCNSNLSLWENGKIKRLPFTTPMAWREQSNHTDDCYFCLTKTQGFNRNTAKLIKYYSLPSAIRPSCEAIDRPCVVNETEAYFSSSSSTGEDEWLPDETTSNKQINQAQLDELIRA